MTYVCSSQFVLLFTVHTVHVHISSDDPSIIVFSMVFVFWYNQMIWSSKAMLSLNSVLISKYSQKLHLRIELVSGAWVVHISLKFWIHLWSKRIWCSLHRFTCCPDLDTHCSKWFHIRSVSGYPSILNMEKRILNVCWYNTVRKKRVTVRIHSERSCYYHWQCRTVRRWSECKMLVSEE